MIRTKSNTEIPTRLKLNKSGEAAIYIFGWYFFSLSISIYNKWMFGKGLNFQFPILITSFHQFCLLILSGIVLYIKPNLRPTINENNNHYDHNDNNNNNTNDSKFKKIKGFFLTFKISLNTYMKQIFPCSLASSGDIGLSNVSFKFVSLSLYTMLKTSSLMFVLIFGLLFRLEKFHWRLVVIVLVMTGSVMMMVKKPDSINSIANDINNEDDGHNNIGIILVLGASMMSGLRWSFTQLLLKHNNYTNNSILTIFYISPSMCLTLFVFGLIFEGWNNFITSPIWELKGILQTIGLMIIPGILAFMMTLCEFKLLSVAQIITLSIAGIFKELLTIILSSIIFGDKLSFINCLGLIFTFIDIMWYNYYRYKQNNSITDDHHFNDNNNENNNNTKSVDSIIEDEFNIGSSGSGTNIANVELRKL